MRRIRTRAARRGEQARRARALRAQQLHVHVGAARPARAAARTARGLVAATSSDSGTGGAGRRPDEQLEPRSYREIRSARYPSGLPDRSDATVLEAFEGRWLLIEHSPEGVEVAGMADDYDDARAWLAAG